MKIIVSFKGGEGSGNFDHAGIPGHVGGSAPGKGSDSPSTAKVWTGEPLTSEEQIAAQIQAGKRLRAKLVDGLDKTHLPIDESRGDVIGHDPDAALLVDKGQLMSTEGFIKIYGENGQCHWNTAKLFEQGAIDNIVIGYTLQHNSRYDTIGWYQHTWGLKDGKIVETTFFNAGNEKYYGVVLNKADSAAFAKYTLSKKPGVGAVRKVQFKDG